MTKIRDVLIALSRRWWAVALAFVLTVAAFGILSSLEKQFEIITGVTVLDAQSDLTPARILEQIPLYQGKAREAYLRIAGFDFLLPLVAGIFVAVLWALLLRLNTWEFSQRLLKLGFPLFMLIGTLWDWAENISLFTLLNAGSVPAPAMLDALILFNRLKFMWLFLIGPITIVLLGLLIANIMYRLWRTRSIPSAAQKTTAP